MTAKLIILNGKQAGQTVSLRRAGDTVIGRESHCEVILDDPACSRNHARLCHEEPGWLVTDLDSANGTCLNGERIDRAGLRDGDKLLIGSTWLRFVEVDRKGEALLQPPATWVLEDSIRPETSLSSISERPADVRRGDLDCLARASTAIAQHTEPQPLVDAVLRIVSDHLQAAGGRMLRPTGQRVFAEHVRTHLPELSDPLVVQAFSTAEAVLVPIREGRDSVRSVFAPLKYLGRVEGVLWLAEDPQEHRFRHEDLCLVASIAHVLAPPLSMLLNVQKLQLKQDSLAAAQNVQVVARSAEMQHVLALVARVADLDNTVLLRGESGVGKEVVARLIHETGTRRDQPLVCVNCAALPESLLESELFGHEKGAFTGAVDQRLGKFELADGGTLFLDELGTMTLATQAKVLRVLDGHPFERVGGHAAIQCDVRVIAATNADLESMVRQRNFREDLYHRLKVIEIRIPPLRERTADIAPLAEQFLQAFVDKTARSLTFEPQALDILRRSDWPGNVRQLRNSVEQAAILAPSSVISATALAPLAAGGSMLDEVVPLEQVNRASIERALASSPNVPAAARLLGLSRSALYRHMKKYGVEPPRRRKDRPGS